MSQYAGRTTRVLAFQGDIWPYVDAWAQQNDFKLVGTDEFSRTYQRGVGAMVLPQMCRIGWNGTNYILETWVICAGPNRVITFGLMPKEVIVEGGGFVASIPRKKAKELVNLLLAGLGEPLIA